MAVLVPMSAITTAQPASAAVCDYVGVLNKSADFASTTAVIGSCGYVGVRAAFNPPGTSTTVNTGWLKAKNNVATGTIREIQTSWHGANM